MECQESPNANTQTGNFMLEVCVKLATTTTEDKERQQDVSIRTAGCTLRDSAVAAITTKGTNNKLKLKRVK